eukprot:gene15280-18089_t
MSTTSPFAQELVATAKAIVAQGKGIMAADESIKTIGKRFSSINLENTEENRRAYRDLLINTQATANYISGIKIDTRTLVIPATADNELVTLDLAGLEDLCTKYYQAAANLLNEPELTNGTDSIDDSTGIYKVLLAEVFKALSAHDVMLEGAIFKMSMITHTSNSPATPERVAELTVEALQSTVPPALAGIVFLSGGQSEIEAIASLNAINKITGGRFAYTFSFGRALQESAIKTWNGKPENIESTRQDLHRALCNSLALAQGEEVIASALVSTN